MIRVGGRSYSNGISFSSMKYTVNFETDNNITKIFLKKNKVDNGNKLLEFLKGIPIIRGIISIFINNKFILLVLLTDFMNNVLLTDLNTGIVEESSKIIVYISCFTILFFIVFVTGYIIMKIFRNIKSTFKYHGAEHKVIFTNYEEKDINLENCRKAPRVSDDCGTMLVSILIFVYIVIKIILIILRINIWFSIEYIITWCISYELFLLNRKTPIICWIFKLGYWFQEHICTIEPSDNQLNQAIDAFNLLKRAEEGQMPDEELQELLKNGKEITY